MKINRPKIKIKGTSPYQPMFIYGLSVIIPKVDKIGRTTYYVGDVESVTCPDLEVVVFIWTNNSFYIVTNRKDIYAVKRCSPIGSTFEGGAFLIPTRNNISVGKISKVCYEYVLEEVDKYINHTVEAR